MRKFIYFVLAAVLIGAVYSFVAKERESQTESSGNTQNTAPAQEEQNTQEVAQPKTESSLDTMPEGTAAVPPSAKTWTVKYDGQKFAPSIITIQKGDNVRFVNEGDGSFWPASNSHPTHDLYPNKGGCINSAFDACEVLPPGADFSFKFDIDGQWGYHDHLNTNATGTVVVVTE